MSEDSDRTGRRVLVALDHSRRSAAALRAAAALAAEAGAELLGLFVEDLDLLRLAELPFAREVGSTSAASRALDFAGIERTLRDQARDLERLLAAEAERVQVRWSFRVARGRVLAEVRALHSEVDLVVLGKVGVSTATRGPEGARQFARQRVPGGAAAAGPVVTVFDGSPSGLRGVSIARRLAEVAGTGLLIVLAAGEDRFSELREACRAEVGSRASYARIDGRVEDIVRVARAEDAGMLVLSGALAECADEAAIAALLESLACPIVFVR